MGIWILPSSDSGNANQRDQVSALNPMSVVFHVECTKQMRRYSSRLISDRRWNIVCAIQIRIVLGVRRCIALVW